MTKSLPYQLKIPRLCCFLKAFCGTNTPKSQQLLAGTTLISCFVQSQWPSMAELAAFAGNCKYSYGCY
jgi:hypothetical protein